ncbi:MAG: hypothetical protein AAB035_03660 [Nitrospirota bacterium]
MHIGRNVRCSLIILSVIFFLTGCGKKNLPYSISIGMDQKEPVFNLRNIVEKTAQTAKAEQSMTLQTFQSQFEALLWEEEKRAWPQRSENNISDSLMQKVASKGLVRFSLDPASSAQSLDRFDELARSAQWVTQLPPVYADERENTTISPLTGGNQDRSTQWCGDPNIAPCKDQQHLLYYTQEEPPDLYKKLGDLSKTLREGGARDSAILVLGYEIPWDKRGTLIRYGANFYFEQKGKEGSGTTTLLGYDIVYASEATPKPLAKDRESAPPQSFGQKLKKNILKIRPRDMVAFPVAAVIGVKNAAFEIAKAPFSLVGGVLSGRDSVWKYPLENFYTAYQALKVELTMGAGAAEDTCQWENSTDVFHHVWRLASEIPVVGPIFLFVPDIRERCSKPSPKKTWLPETTRLPKEILPTATTTALFLSRGIYGGNHWGQDTGLWAAFAKEAYPAYDIYSPPYRHGTVIDVVWSLLSLSHGPAYDEVAYIMEHANRNDKIYLTGHSGGVQRSVVASRILWHHGYQVSKIVGIAGPHVGQAFIDRRYPDAFRVFLNKDSGNSQDLVSTFVYWGDAIEPATKAILSTGPKYIIGAVCLSNEHCRDQVHSTFDRVGLTNAKTRYVDSKPSTEHHTPLRLSFSDSLIYDGYVRTEFATIFRDDLLHNGEIQWRRQE